MARVPLEQNWKVREIQLRPSYLFLLVLLFFFFLHFFLNFLSLGVYWLSIFQTLVIHLYATSRFLANNYNRY